jgi:hypothetical protein
MKSKGPRVEMGVALAALCAVAWVARSVVAAGSPGRSLALLGIVLVLLASLWGWLRYVRSQD